VPFVRQSLPQPLRVSEGFWCCPIWPTEKSNLDRSERDNYLLHQFLGIGVVSPYLPLRASAPEVRLSPSFVANSARKEMTSPCSFRKAYLSGRQARRPFTARLNPCPSFDSLFPSLLGSVKASGAVQFGQLKNLIWTGLKGTLPIAPILGDRCRVPLSPYEGFSP
jgi:hypothetical protein